MSDSHAANVLDLTLTVHRSASGGFFMTHVSEAGLSGRADTDHTAGIVNSLLGDIALLHGEITHLREALVSRAVIDQAKGMLMLSYRISDEAAFALLARLSQNTNTKLRVVAQAVVDTSGWPNREPAARPGAAPSLQASGATTVSSVLRRVKRPSDLLR